MANGSFETRAPDCLIASLPKFRIPIRKSSEFTCYYITQILRISKLTLILLLAPISWLLIDFNFSPHQPSFIPSSVHCLLHRPHFLLYKRSSPSQELDNTGRGLRSEYHPHSLPSRAFPESGMQRHQKERPGTSVSWSWEVSARISSLLKNFLWSMRCFSAMCGVPFGITRFRLLVG
jgi:hypothetical protein